MRGVAVASLGRGLRIFLTVLVLPHELAHYLAVRPWSRSVRIVFLSGRAGSGPLDVGLARLTGEFSPAIPTTALRLCAAAPPLVFLPLAVVVDRTLGIAGVSAGTVALAVVFAGWSTPSAGDVFVFRTAPEFKTAGTFDETGTIPDRDHTVANVLTVAVAWFLLFLFFT